MRRFAGENAFTTLPWGTTKWGTTRRLRDSSVSVPAFPNPSNQPDLARGRLLEKEPSNLQAQSLNNLIEDKATRGESHLKQLYGLADAFSQTDTSEWPSQAAPQPLGLCCSRA